MRSSFDLHVFRIDDGDVFWYIATSEEEALRAYRTDPQREKSEDDAPLKVTQLADRDPLTITNEDHVKLTFTAREWCSLEVFDKSSERRDHGPRNGYLGSTCY